MAIIKQSPTIERINQTAVEIRYEHDPYVLSENRRLADELDVSIVTVLITRLMNDDAMIE